MADPTFGFDQIDPGSVEGGGKPVTVQPPASGAGSNFWYDYFRNSAGQTAANPFNTTNQDQSRGWQQQVMQGLQRQAAGDLNSSAQQALQQGYANARAGQSALGSATRGTGGAAGLRQGAMGAGNVQRGFVGDQQMLMRQEQQGAQAALAQMLAQQNSQDAALAQMLAQNQLGVQGINDQRQAFGLGGALNADLSATQQQNQIARAQLGFNEDMTSLTNDLLRRGLQAGATAAGAAGGMFGGSQQSGFRQVGGQDSIVPTWDK